MDVKIIKKRKDANSIPLENNSFMENRIGFWANVCEVDSQLNIVNVISDTGLRINGLPVASKEWVNKVDGNEYVSGSRNLPQIGTRVFVLAPTHTAAGSFVLCSGFSRGDTSKQVFFSDKDNKDKNNNIEESVDQSGWKYKRYYKNGNTIFESKDSNISFSVGLSEDSKENIEKKIVLNAWGNKITIDKNGIILIDKNNAKIITSSSGVEIYKNKDNANTNYIKLGNGITLKGSSGTVEIT